jgi:hypothetical protein
MCRLPFFDAAAAKLSAVRLKIEAIVYRLLRRLGRSRGATGPVTLT